MTFDGTPQHGNLVACVNCGAYGVEHEKEKVFPDDGPAGSWHWRYNCPGGSGRYSIP